MTDKPSTRYDAPDAKDLAAAKTTTMHDAETILDLVKSSYFDEQTRDLLLKFHDDFDIHRVESFDQVAKLYAWVILQSDALPAKHSKMLKIKVDAIKGFQSALKDFFELDAPEELAKFFQAELERRESIFKEILKAAGRQDLWETYTKEANAKQATT